MPRYAPYSGWRIPGLVCVVLAPNQESLALRLLRLAVGLIVRGDGSRNSSHDEDHDDHDDADAGADHDKARNTVAISTVTITMTTSHPPPS